MCRENHVARDSFIFAVIGTNEIRRTMLDENRNGMESVEEEAIGMKRRIKMYVKSEARNSM